jgi:hypothetical protein
MLFRVLFALWGVWFTAAVLEVPGLHACGVHAASGQHHAPAAASHEHSHGAPAPSSSEAPADAADCTCLGHCCGVSPVEARVDAAPAAAEVAIDTDASFVGCDLPPVIRRPFDRPFANGPPVA